jgi:pyruvate formate lyase activating enzyme
MDSDKHRLYTGVGNELILQNIRYLAERQAQFSIRIPLIEGINADEENIGATAQFLSSIPHPIHLLPYHDVGKDKHRRMGSIFNPKGYPMAAPSEETLERCKQQLEAQGLQVIIGG